MTPQKPPAVPPYPAFDRALRAIVAVPKSEVDAARRKEVKAKQRSRRKGK